LFKQEKEHASDQESPGEETRQEDARQEERQALREVLIKR
jgi:hypothetical protein